MQTRVRVSFSFGFDFIVPELSSYKVFLIRLQYFAFSFSFGFDFIVPELSPDCPRASLTKNFKFRFASPKRRQTHAFGCKTLAIRNFAFRLHFVSELSPDCARASSNPMRP